MRIQAHLPPEDEAGLEAQLAQVVERDGVTTFVPHGGRKRRKRSRANSRERVILAIQGAGGSEVDAVRSHDHLLVRSVTGIGTTGAPTQRLVSVRHVAQHTSSPHILKMGSLASKRVVEMRMATDIAVRHWLAPYEEPPSLEAIAAEVNDLYVGEIDPRFFVEQFTPATADLAYAESYSLWSRLRAPFVRWEMAQTVVPERRSVVAAEEVPAEAWVETEEIVAMAPIEEQFTAADPEIAFQRSYGIRSRVAAVVRRWFTRADTLVEEVRDYEHDLIAQTQSAWRVPVMVPKLDFVRVMAGFIGLMVVVSLPAGAVSMSRSFGSSVTLATAQGEDALRLSQSAAGEGTGASFAAASARFADAERTLLQANAIGSALAQALPDTRAKLKTAQALLESGKEASAAAVLLSRAVDRLFAEGDAPDEKLLLFATNLDAAAPHLERAEARMAQVKVDALPADLQKKAKEMQEMLHAARTTLRETRRLAALLPAIVGHDMQRTYLLAFQNHTELRPTGGFMGSVAEVTMDRGKITKVFVPGGGPYDLRSQLKQRVLPPKPLQLVSGRWEFQDANWFPDFPAAAQKIRWFWEKSSQPSLDGVIAVNATIMEKVLLALGPVELPAYGKTITAENFLMETQKAVELEYDKEENKPKKIIGDLMEVLVERVKKADRETQMRLLTVVAEALDTKEVQLALFRAQEATVFADFGWDGAMKPVTGDTLAVVEANIAGQKTDAVIDEQVDLRVKVGEDGSLTNTVTLVRKHTGEKGELFRGANNVSYLRLYVPQGATLVSAEGFESPAAHFWNETLPEDGEDPDVARLVKASVSTVDQVDVTQEFGRTAFGGWIQLPPGATRTTSFTYRLPFTIHDLGRALGSGRQDEASRAAYTLFLGSQSGKPNRQVRVTIDAPPALKAAYASGISQALTAEQVWDRDRVVGVLFE